MATTVASETQEKRLLRLTVAHYRKEDCAEQDLYRWATEVYTPQAEKIFTKYGLEGFVLHMSPASFRAAAKALNAARGDRWLVRDHDFQVEFYLRDPAVLARIGADPEFQALQKTEGPYVSSIHVEAGLGWIETYMQDGKVVNLTDDGKPCYLDWATMSAVA